MPGGYMGKLLRIDLTERSVKVEELEEPILRRYIGGSGLAAKILNEETGSQTDPLGPENRLIFMTGPFTGTRIPTSGRHAVVAKSPLTGIWGEGDVGGGWGTALKRAGFDGVVVTGQGESPVYLWIHDGGVEIRDAGHLWGKDTYEADDLLKAETRPDAVVSVIGPAGENLVKIAAIMTDGRDARAVGRCGLGAVMGSKNLKAVVAAGDMKPEVADQATLDRLVKEIAPRVREGTKGMHDNGTAGGIIAIEHVGDLPIKNWSQGSWPEGAAKLSGQRLAQTILTRRYYCGACIIGCGRVTEVKEGPYRTGEGAGPEYETLACLGAMCLVEDLEAVNLGNELCNRYGLDTISAGAAIAFAMEAYERGLITAADTGGREIRWGDPDVMLALLRDIAFRQGLGNLLAEGVRSAAGRLGQAAHELAIHVKGLELPGHDPRAYNSLAVGYATSNRGACHLQGFSHVFEKNVTMPELGYSEILDRFAAEGKGEMTAKAQDLAAMFDALKMCKFSLFGGVKVTHMVQFLRAVTGWDFDVAGFMKTGERIFNLKRLYNVRCGVTRKDDTLPARIRHQKRGEGGAAENLPPLDSMLDEYYEYRGWDKNGIPRAEKLAELGLDDQVGPS